VQERKKGRSLHSRLSAITEGSCYKEVKEAESPGQQDRHRGDDERSAMLCLCERAEGVRDWKKGRRDHWTEHGTCHLMR